MSEPEFEKWLLDNDCTISKNVKIDYDKNTIKVIDTVEKGEPFVIISKKAIISSDIHFKDNSPSLLVATLLVEMLKNEESNYFPYIKSLPPLSHYKSHPITLFKTFGHRWKLFMKGEFYKAMRGIYYARDHMFVNIRSNCKRLSNVSREDFDWAFITCNVISKDGVRLIPILDTLKHETSGCTDVVTLDSQEQLISNSILDSGSYVSVRLDNYNVINNFLKYNVTKVEFISVDVSINVDNISINRLKNSLLKTYNSDDTLGFTKDGPTNSLTTYLRIVEMSPLTILDIELFKCKREEWRTLFELLTKECMSRSLRHRKRCEDVINRKTDHITRTLSSMDTETFDILESTYTKMMSSWNHELNLDVQYSTVFGE
jgi:hypothetical protein